VSIKVCSVVKKFGSFAALDNVSIEIPEGELTALLGPSGSGKTTLLRIIAGLEIADQGKIFFNEQDISSKSPQERNMGFVFQHYALFRHMNVFDNIAFGLKIQQKKKRLSKADIEGKVGSLLQLTKMEGYARHYPSQLSGGQRQRIALARALAVEPKVLLLDEPFGALDASVRKELRRWLRRFHEEFNVTSIFVTHDQEEALDVASQIVIMNKGKIEQVGTPEDVYENPATPFVCRFLGSANCFESEIRNNRIKIGGFEIDKPACIQDDELKVISFVRPHDITISQVNTGKGTVEARITAYRAIGQVVFLELQRTDTGEIMESEIDKEECKKIKLEPGGIVYARFKNLKIYSECS
jgi:sulfate transport system ATP-binding protein